LNTNEDSENHWPGYVDALTTMTMMLIFVMMILSVAIFNLSENVSRNLVEKIAQSAGITLSSDGFSTEEFAQKIVAKLEGRGSVGARGGSVVAANTPVSSGGNPGGEGTAIREGLSSVLAKIPGEEHVISSNEGAKTLNIDAPVGVAKTPALITLTFKPRATALDEAAQNEMKTFIETANAEHAQTRFDLKAYASADLGALSDSRRVAYYRAMAVRARLINIGIAPTRISVQVLDRASPESTDRVQVFTGIAAANAEAPKP
jgi:hypothetical protein